MVCANCDCEDCRRVRDAMRPPSRGRYENGNWIPLTRKSSVDENEHESKDHSDE